ncbi:hypothetical protein [Rhizobium sp. LjRoot258]|uniref:hypothetical protein n=1 Tax=Rhizobium sp. LjRoot258 TaxID=3342299 RepID=UPI003ECDE1A4
MDKPGIALSGAPVGMLFGKLKAIRVTAVFLLTLSLLSGEVSLAAQSSDILRVAETSGEKDLTGSISKYPSVQSCLEPNSKLRLEPYWRDLNEKSDLWVCFFRIIEQLKTDDEIRSWLAQFDIKLVKAPYSRLGPNGHSLGFMCRKINPKCRIKWNRVEVTIPYILTPYAFGFIAYYKGEKLEDFQVTVERE